MLKLVYSVLEGRQVSPLSVARSMAAILMTSPASDGIMSDCNLLRRLVTSQVPSATAAYTSLKKIRLFI